MESPSGAKPRNPYLEPGRLASLIAAIQAMGAATWGGSELERWIDQLELPQDDPNASGDVSAGALAKWKQVFQDHPEFFYVYAAGDGKRRVGLRWRYAGPITFDTHLLRELTADELASLTKNDAFYKRFTRKPLSADQIGVLLNTAIELHTRALAEREARHWYLPVVSAIVGGLFGAGGALLGAWLKR